MRERVDGPFQEVEPTLSNLVLRQQSYRLWDIGKECMGGPLFTPSSSHFKLNNSGRLFFVLRMMNPKGQMYEPCCCCFPQRGLVARPIRRDSDPGQNNKPLRNILLSPDYAR